MPIRRAFASAIAAAALTAGVAVATHDAVGLSSTLLARGGWDRDDRTEFLAALSAQGRAARSEVAVVKATLQPGGSTFWHGHPGPSVVVVTAGSVTVLEPAADGSCTETVYGVGDAFVHGAGNHDFRNPGSVPTELYITYFVTAWPPLIHTGEPVACA